MNKVYLDTDVLMDFLYQRQPFFPSAVRLIARLEEGKTRGFVSTLIIWNLMYLLQKEFGRTQGKRILQDLRSLVTLVAVDEKIVDQALASDIKDFEDAIQYFAARSSKLDTIITRNKKDYPQGTISLLTCEEFLAQAAR